MASRFAATGITAAALSVLLLTSVAAEAAGDPARGRKLAYTCHGCHGIENYKNAYPNYSVPRLGGQHATYIVAALTEYENRARWHPTMQGLASTLSAQDKADIAAYLEGEKPVVSSGTTVGTAPAAAQACAACHGPDGVGILPEYPVIAGQHPDYIERALKDYRAGKRTNAIMNPFAQQLSDADIAAVAAYFAAQKGLHTLQKR
jgi:cytochrome c553